MLLTKEQVIQAIQSGESLADYSRFQDDFDVVSVAVQEYGYALKYVSKRLRDNEEIVKLALQQNGRSLKYASERLRDNEDIIVLAVQHNGYVLKYASDRIQQTYANAEEFFTSYQTKQQERLNQLANPDYLDSLAQATKLIKQGKLSNKIKW